MSFCEGNSPVTGEFPAQRDSNVENVSIWWRHHVIRFTSESIQSNKCTEWIEDDMNVQFHILKIPHT